MIAFPPFVNNITVNAIWNGDVSCPVNAKITINAAVRGTSQLPLIQNSHPSVESIQFSSVTKLPQRDELALPSAPRTCLSHAQTPSVDTPTPLSGSRSKTRDHEFLWKQQLKVQHIVPDLKACSQGVKPYQGKEVTKRFSENDPAASTRRAPTPLFSQTASLFDVTSSRGTAVSPLPPPTLKRLTIPKRLSVEQNSNASPPRLAEKTVSRRQNESCSSQSVRKKPLTQRKRPPWRPVGAEDTTPRGRRGLGTERTKRKISRSLGPPRSNRALVRQRRSSLPDRMPKSGRVWPTSKTLHGEVAAQVVPRGTSKNSAIRTGSQERDITVKITRYDEALNAGERVEQWLQHWQNYRSVEDLPASTLPSDEKEDNYRPHLRECLASALSPSPTPSSRAGLPWTSIPGLRGGAFPAEKDGNPADDELDLTFINDNGTMSAYFHGCSTGESQGSSFLIEFHTSIKLQIDPFGVYSLIVPGLPLQSGNLEGTVNLTVSSPPSSKEHTFEAYEKVAYVDEHLAPQPLHQDALSKTFRLDMPFKLDLLCFQPCRVLDPSEFEVDCDIRTRYDWENLDEDGLAAEHSMICSIRLRPFLMWAETAMFKLYLTGGPSGTLEVFLGQGNRRVYLNGKQCQAQHVLEIGLTCPVADLQKTFILSWEQPLGLAPFEVWLPRISGLRWKKLEEVFGLPEQAEITTAPDLCRDARMYSIAAQERFLRRSRGLSLLPETQLTPRSICHSLMEQSGQFYEKLTATNPESNYEGGDSPLVSKKGSLSPKLSNGSRIGQSTFLRQPVTASSTHPADDLVLGNQQEASMDAIKKAESAEVDHVQAKASGWKSVAFRAPFSPLRVVLHYLSQNIRRAGFLNAILVAWLCFGTFYPERKAQLGDSFVSIAKETWNRWDFQPVQLHGDMTGWKHLMARVRNGEFPAVETENDEAAESVVSPPKGDEEMLEGVSTASEEAVAQVMEDEEESVAHGMEEDGQSPIPMMDYAKDRAADESGLTWLDRLDMALGWKPPAGT